MAQMYNRTLLMKDKNCCSYLNGILIWSLLFSYLHLQRTKRNNRRERETFPSLLT
jgi:hypothetical protein